MNIIGQNGNEGIHYEDNVVEDKEVEPIKKVEEPKPKKKKPSPKPHNPWGNPGGAR